MSTSRPNELVIEVNGVTLQAREADRYVNATLLCKAAGKAWGQYFLNKGTKDYLAALSVKVGIPILSLIESRKGKGGGTWIHPQVVIHFAQWASPDFAVMVTDWAARLLAGETVTLTEKEKADAAAAVKNDLKYDYDRHYNDPNYTPADNVEDDPLYKAIMSVGTTVAMIADVRRRQLILERDQAVVHRTANEARVLAEAAMAQAENNHGYFQIIGYAKRRGMEMTEQQASAHGKAVSRICRERGIHIGSQAHPRYGDVNSYPESVLREYFRRFEGQCRPIDTDDQQQTGLPVVD